MAADHEAVARRRRAIVLSLLTLLMQTQIHADPLVSDATACDGIKVDARVLCHNQVDARQDKNEPPYLIEVWLGYRSGGLYLAEPWATEQWMCAYRCSSRLEGESLR
jgi:hypothetical protein